MSFYNMIEGYQLIDMIEGYQFIYAHTYIQHKNVHDPFNLDTNLSQC